MTGRPPARLLETWLLPAAWGLLLVWIAVRLAGRAPDDMYITFRYAWNLAHGEGFVFNPGERVFGLTNPGLGLTLALLHGVTRVPVHLVGTAVYAVSLWGLATVLWLEGRGRDARIEAGVGGTLVVASSYLWLNQGSAGASVLALLAITAVAAEKWPVGSGVLAGVAVWFRPDAVLGVGLLGLLLWVRRRRLPWRWGWAAAALIGCGLLAAWAWFGSPLPGTLEAKQTMAEVRETTWTGERFWARPAGFMHRHWGSAWELVAAAGVAGLLPAFLRGGKAMRSLVLYGLAVAVAYPLLGVPFFSWYVVPSAVAVLYGLAALATVLANTGARAVADGRWPLLAWGLAALLLAAPVWGIARASWRWLDGAAGAGRYASYREAALWVRDHTLPEERIAFGEIGNVAYWSERPVDDLLGLVTPKVLPYVRADDTVGAFLALEPDVFLDHPRSPHPGLVDLPWFREAYHLAARIEPPPDGAGAVTVYRRRPGAVLPAPSPRGKNRPSPP